MRVFLEHIQGSMQCHNCWNIFDRIPVTISASCTVDPSVGDVFSLDYSVFSSFIVQSIDIMNDVAELDSLAKQVQAKFNLKELTLELNAKLIHGNLISTVVLENEHLTIHNSLKNIHVFCIIGIHAYERIQKQKIVIDCKIQGKADFRMIGRRIYNLAEASSFETVEALCQYLGENMLKIVPNIAVRVGKTSAVSLANLAGIEMEFSNSRSHSLPVICYIGVGCNVGNRLENISRAFKLICQQVDVLDTSLLYESDPMYLLDQPTFLNSVIKVRTSMPPEDLLKFLKNIEQQLHRDFDTVRNGPRTIDLDILYYGDLCVSSEVLNIPHLRLCEREFVLRPLSDVAPNFTHPVRMETNETLLELLCASENHKSSVKRVFPVGNRLLYLDRPFLMAIVNMTPDSFSDGGKYISDSTETPSFGKALQSCLDLIRDGADILDIGGQSTRPNATLISEEEEVNRVIPLIKMIREKSNIPISIDTFYSSVARKALECGADIVNDITGGTRDPEMLRVVSETGASMCIMHMRGDSKTMMGLTDYTDGVVNEVIRSLDKMITGAIGKSIPRWNLLADPGLGFAKSGDQNYDLIRNAALIEKAVRVPLLWGPSRKRFIGDVVKKDASERVFGTGAVCTSLVYSSNSALFLRVHDVKEMADIVKVAVLCKK